MSSFLGKKFRAAVLAVVFSIAVVPIAAAAPREQSGLNDPLARIVRFLKKALTPASNADSLTIPRP